MSTSSSNGHEPIVLLINSIDHEGVLSTLRAIGKGYRLKYLHSSVDNWLKTIKLFEKYDITAVLGKITSTTCLYFAREDYKQVTQKLFEKVSQKPNLFFMFEGLMARKEEIESQDDLSEPYVTDLPSEEVLDTTNDLIERYELNVLPYITRAEVTISAQSFIEHVEENLIFRVYLPAGHIWEHEIDRVIVLFRDYLSKLSKKSVRLDQVRTNNGVIYAFHSDGRPEKATLASDFNEFKDFLDICVREPSKAEAILKGKGINSPEIDDILTRYSKEARRIQIDLKHSRESKLLAVKHKLESELIDFLPTDFDDRALSQIVDSIIPQPTGVASINTLPSTIEPPTNTSISLNVNQQFINKVQGVVSHAISGNITYSPEEKDILRLIDQHGQNKNAELVSSLNELKDPSVPKSDRVTAKQRLKKFLAGCSNKVGDMAFSILQKYLESQILG